MSHSICLEKIQWRRFCFSKVFQPSFTIKFVNPCADRCCDWNTIEKDHSVNINSNVQQDISNTLYMSNDSLVVWSIIIFRYIFTHKDSGKVFFFFFFFFLFLMSCDFKKQEYTCLFQDVQFVICKAWCKLCCATLELPSMFMFAKL